jgi:hypothetical protein
MLVKIKREEVLRLDQTLDAVSKMPATRFAYAVARNKKKLQEEVESIKTALAPSPKLVEYEEKRRQLVLQHAAKTKDGQPDIDQLGNARLADFKAFDDGLKDLKEKYQDALKEYDAKTPERVAFLSESIEIDLYEIPTKNLPKELRAEDLYMLMPVITGDPSELPE